MKSLHCQNRLLSFVLVGITLLFLSTPCFSKSSSQKIREATYLFEMKGEYDEATKLLEEVSRTGNKQEQAEADFLLGKIQELYNKKEGASFYYLQNLLHTKIPAQAYWDAERLARITPEPEILVKNTLALPAPLKQVFFGDSVQILLANHILFNPESKKQTQIPEDIPYTAPILHISESGIWWKQDNVLNFTPLHPIYPFQSISIQNELGAFLPLSPHLVAYLDGEQLILRSGNNERFKTQAKYRDCSIQEEKFKKETLLLNCPDNALHILSKDNGNEIATISMLDPISKIHQDSSGLLLFSGDGLWFFAHEKTSVPQWRINSLAIEHIVSFGRFFAVLETSGHIILLDKHNGANILRTKTLATSIIPLHTGMLGFLSRDGEILATDTLLRPLWNFHLGESFIYTPWIQNGLLYYPISTDSIKILNALHYGKKPLLSQSFSTKANWFAKQNDWENALSFSDSALTLEPGNLDANFLKALHLEKSEASLEEKEKAWAKTISITARGSSQRNKILAHYAKIIGAEFIEPLPISQQTIYPQFFSHKKTLFSIDAASRQLIALNAKKGTLRWTQDIGKIESAPVTAHHENWLALGSGFSLKIINLEKPTETKTIDLPGKIFHTSFSSKYLLISTWNGFLVKILLPSFQQAWVRKISTQPIFCLSHKNQIIATTTAGDLSILQESSGLPLEKNISLQAQITNVVAGDSAVAFISSDLRVLLYTAPSAPILTLSLGQEILSAAFIRHPEQGPSLLLSLSNQELRLYSLPKGNIIWKFKGTHSVFGKFALHKNSVWIDQKKQIVELSLKTGKPLRKFSVAGEANSPFLVDNMLFCATPQQLLLGFNLDKTESRNSEENAKSLNIK